MDTTALLKSVPTGLWIGGEEREGKSTFNVLDPSDDQVLTAVADATAEDAIAALDAACAVQAEWAATAAARTRRDPARRSSRRSPNAPRTSPP